MSRFPDTLPGYWDTAGGREMAERYIAMDRAQLGKADLSDMALANAQYLEDISVGTVTFQSAIGMQTAAKERIRWLSAHLAAANAALIDLNRHARPDNWDDSDDPEQAAAWRNLDAFLSKALGTTKDMNDGR